MAHAGRSRAHATEMGNIHARIVGRGLRSSDCTPHFVYVSPALCCVQTATAVTRDTHTLLRIEPALFEWIGNWLAGELQEVGPAFLTVSMYGRVDEHVDGSHRSANCAALASRSMKRTSQV